MDLHCIPSEIFLHQDMLEEVTCSIGSGVMYNPVVLPCQHRFCRTCIEGWLEKQAICPICKRDVQKTELKQDEGVWKIIGSYKVKCANQSCTWQGKYCERESHVEKYCEFTEITCELGCGEKYQRKSAQTHLTDCSFAPVICQACKGGFRKCKLSEHSLECPAMPVECPNKCAQSVPRSHLKEHLLRECSERLLPCKYNVGGCKFQGNNANLEAHYKESMETHLNTTYDLVTDLMNKIQILNIQQTELMTRQYEMEKKAGIDNEEKKMRKKVKEEVSIINPKPSVPYQPRPSAHVYPSVVTGPSSKKPMSQSMYQKETPQDASPEKRRKGKALPCKPQ